MKPERQTIFGQGSNGIFNATSSSNWGPAITGQSYTDWNGRTQNMQYFDNVANFFKTGVNLTENIAFRNSLIGHPFIYQLPVWTISARFQGQSIAVLT